VQLGWLPLGGCARSARPAAGLDAALDVARHLVLPALALGAGYVALYLRTLREGMVEAWRADHVRARRRAGCGAPRWCGARWRGPALLPVVALLGQHVGTLVGGSIVIETVFAIPGMGRLAFEAVAGRDTPLLVGVVLGATIVVILANLVADLLLARLDPRIGDADA
jgi:peptide/nickel transport system permease protein